MEKSTRRIRLREHATPAPPWLDLEEAAEREAGAEGPEEQPCAEERQRVQGERERVDVGAAPDVRQDRRQRDLLAEDEQQHGEEGASEAAEQSLEHERPADEPVRRADELHDLDLPSPGEDR